MPIIKVENLSKKYILSHKQGESYTNLRDVIYESFKAVSSRVLRPFAVHNSPITNTSQEDFWALKDVAFEINQGDRVGVIGRNGAGKSTLLKILSRITEPTSGKVGINGRVASLLEVGTGFHPELTGRENIYLNGAILGMGRLDIKRKFDEIVAFAEVERFLDTPVKRYSSGMYVRLAFAVAAHLEPEILIVDEVLAVGDAMFQKKCLGKMKEVGSAGRTVIFVSHNMGAIHSLTKKCVYLDMGEMLDYGDTTAVVAKYLSNSYVGAEDKIFDLDFYRPDYVLKAYKNECKVHFTKIWAEYDKKPVEVLDMGASFNIFFELEATSEISGANISFAIFNSEYQPVTIVFSWDNDYYLNILPGKHVIRLDIYDLVLTPGKYYVGTGINQYTESVAWDSVTNLPLFEVKNSGKVVHWLHRKWGNVQCENVHWHIEKMIDQ